MKKAAACVLLAGAFVIGLTLGIGPSNAEAVPNCVYICDWNTGEITKCCRYPVIGWVCQPEPGSCVPDNCT